MLKGRYYDGTSSQQKNVTIIPNSSSELRVIGDGIRFTCPLSDIKVSSRVGNTRRHLNFPDGSQCETDDNDAVDQLLSGIRGEATRQLLHHWESSIGYVLGAILITVSLLWLGVNHGIPALAKRIAFSLPATTEKMLGQEALAGLDKTLLEPTRLSIERQAELKALFAGMTSSIEGAQGYQIEFRSSRTMGPNALALPSGIVVITDALVNLSKNNDELVAVLAHEIGHLKQRHELRRLLQSSATGILLIAITGDLSSVASLGAWLPVLLVDTKYSRSFETEADEFSLDYLNHHNIPTHSFVDILQRIANRSGANAPVPDFISTHPATSERIQNFQLGRNTDLK